MSYGRFMVFLLLISMPCFAMKKSGSKKYKNKEEKDKKTLELGWEASQVGTILQTILARIDDIDKKMHSIQEEINPLKTDMQQAITVSNQVFGLMNDFISSLSSSDKSSSDKNENEDKILDIEEPQEMKKKKFKINKKKSNEKLSLLAITSTKSLDNLSKNKNKKTPRGEDLTLKSATNNSFSKKKKK